MVGCVAALASILRLYALYNYTVTEDAGYDGIFVSALDHAHYHRLLTNTISDPPSFSNRSKRCHDVCLRPSLPSTLCEAFLVVLLRPVKPNYRRVSHIQ